MKRRLILAVAFVLTIVVSAVSAFRLQQVPSLLTIDVTLKGLTRIRDQSYAGQILYSMHLTARNESSDNVTLVSAFGYGNLTSEAYWRLEIVLNNSRTTIPPWIHDITPENQTAGQYGGTVSTSLAVKGAFTLWIILFSVHEAKYTVIWSTSELIRIY